MVRFPIAMEIEAPETLAAFQKDIRAAYPIGTRETTQDLVVGDQRPAPKQVWRFEDDHGWRLSLSQDFLAIETRRYASRQDLLDRLGRALTALAAHVKLDRVDRLGVRYIDRMVGDELRDIRQLIRPEIAGIASTQAMPACQHAFSDNAFAIDNDRLVARWGLLPPRSSIDPGVKPIEGPSWLLDLDMVSQEPFAFDVEAIRAKAEHFATRIYTFFRWAVTNEFLKRYGGSV